MEIKRLGNAVPRPSCTAAERLLPKIWVAHLLRVFDTDLAGLNAQLTLPIEEGGTFEWMKHPRPLPRPRAPALFDRAYRLGNDPDNDSFKDPFSENVRFNLFSRVSDYVPYSEDWLFRELRPYCARRLPSIEHACLTIGGCLERLGLRRQDAQQIDDALALNRICTLLHEDFAFYDLIEVCEPIHLVLLFSLLHERQWAHPGTEQSFDLFNACHRAVERFCMRDEFDRNEEARALRTELTRELGGIACKIIESGHRYEPKRPLGLLPERAVFFEEAPAPQMDKLDSTTALFNLPLPRSRWCHYARGHM